MRNKIIYGLLFSFALTFVGWTDLFYKQKLELSDFFYQESKITSPEIIIIGIDAHSIDTLGSFPFDRTVFADLLTLLNESDTPPIAIGVDVLFTGETNSESDESLVKAVSGYDNIILATSANYTTELVINSANEYYLSNQYLDSMNYPFPDLLEVAQLGHINSSLDEDGILRHATLNISLPTGEVIPSLHLALYEKYCDFHGFPMGEMPENHWYLPFQSKSGGYYDGYGISKVLSGEIPTSVFKDKIVLVGPYTIGLQDHFYTAIDHTNYMYGVEYQANAVEVLMNQNFITEISSEINLIFLFLGSFILFFFSYRRKVIPTAVVFFALSAVMVLGSQKLYDFGYLLDVFYPLFSLFSLLLLHILLDAIYSSIEKAKVTATFKRYVAPNVVEQILKEGTDSLQLGGSTTEVAVMFIDVRNFTPMSEKFPPETVIEILNRLMDVMSETIMENQGTLDKFIGDAVMCFWNAPLPQENYVEKAVETALQILENIQPIVEEVEGIHKHRVAVGIGIQCGSAVVGNVGSHRRMDYTVIGDTVNTAARLESNAKTETLLRVDPQANPNENIIIVSGQVYEACQDKFTFREIPDGLKLKGKEKQFQAFLVSRGGYTNS